MPADRDPDGDAAHRERLERAEVRRERRRERAGRAARARSKGGQTPDGGDDGPDDENGSTRGHLWRLSMVLRNVAFVLLVVGFIGLTVADDWLDPADSPYALVFGGGVLCAVASIYLAIYQHDDVEA